MEAVPLKATTTVLLPQPTKQRVSCLVSQKLWEWVSLYRLKAVSTFKVVLAVKDVPSSFSCVPCFSCCSAVGLLALGVEMLVCSCRETHHHMGCSNTTVHAASTQYGSYLAFALADQTID